jgi:hypothetical protein
VVTFPRASQQYIVDKNIKVAYLDGFKIAREETNHPDLQFRMQGIAFQGAFFESSPIAENAGKRMCKNIRVLSNNDINMCIFTGNTNRLGCC